VSFFLDALAALLRWMPDKVPLILNGQDYDRQAYDLESAGMKIGRRSGETWAPDVSILVAAKAEQAKLQ
jgi:hypothetical protein